MKPHIPTSPSQLEIATKRLNNLSVATELKEGAARRLVSIRRRKKAESQGSSGGLLKLGTATGPFVKFSSV